MFPFGIDGKNAKLIFFDLETTGISLHSEIVQIGAVSGSHTSSSSSSSSWLSSSSSSSSSSLTSLSETPAELSLTAKCQHAAVDTAFVCPKIEDEKSFQSYCLPRGPFEPGASRVNGLSIGFASPKRKLTTGIPELLYRGLSVADTIDMVQPSARHSLTLFIHFMNTVAKAAHRVPPPAAAEQPGIVLVAHNAPFDMYFLLKAAVAAVSCEGRLSDKNDKWTATSILRSTAADAAALFLDIPVIGFLDTLPLFRLIYPHFPSHRLESLVQHVIPEFSATGSQMREPEHQQIYHSALFDAIALKRVFEHSVRCNMFHHREDEISQFFSPLTRNSYTSLRNALFP
jgi:DNA polymerase III epsilon subunit-like protein